MNTIDIVLIIVSALATISSNFLVVRNSNNRTNDRLDQIEKNVEKNQNEFSTFVARMYKAEEDLKIHDEKIKVVNHRIDDLERKVQDR